MGKESNKSTEQINNELQSQVINLRSKIEKLEKQNEELKEFLYNEIIERRDYSASKAFEVVLEQINKSEDNVKR